MEIKTKYNIGDLLRHQYSSDNGDRTVLKVLEIESLSCYAGTQVFYKCRHIYIKPKTCLDKGVRSFFGVSGNGRMQMETYREDELLTAEKIYTEILDHMEEEHTNTVFES